MLAFAQAPAPDELIAKLECLVELSPEERSALRGLPNEIVKVSPGERVRVQGEVPSSSFLVLEGLVCSSKEGADGRRQITSLYIPGDMPGLRALHLGRADSDITAITACRLAHFGHADLRALCRAYPGIAEAFWRCTLVVSSVYQEWVVNVGARPALGRLAHLFCEMMARLEAAGLARNGSCDLPLTQDHLGQATGLSRIHANRSLQELRRLGLVTFENGHLTIRDWDGLARLGQFDPGYLFLAPPRWRAAQPRNMST